MEHYPIEHIAISILDAAKALGIGRSTTYELINDGKLHAIKLGRRTLVTVESIKALVGSAKVVGDAGWEKAA